MKLSLRNAINEMCKECLFDPLEPGSWTAQVGGCTAKRCPLYKVRPGQRSNRSDLGPSTPKK